MRSFFQAVLRQDQECGRHGGRRDVWSSLNRRREPDPLVPGPYPLRDIAGNAAASGTAAGGEDMKEDSHRSYFRF